jgi:hypothetical protein
MARIRTSVKRNHGSCFLSLLYPKAINLTKITAFRVKETVVIIQIKLRLPRKLSRVLKNKIKIKVNFSAIY